MTTTKETTTMTTTKQLLDETLAAYYHGMIADANIKPVTAEIIWHRSAQGQTPFAWLEHDGQAYLIRLVERGIDIFHFIEGDDCNIARVDTVAEAREFISLYASFVY